MGDAIRDKLAARMASLLGLPLSNIKMLMPLVSEDECERLLSLEDQQFMTESTKAIAGAQQRQFQGDAPAASGPSPSASPMLRPKLQMMQRPPEEVVPAESPEPPAPSARPALQLKPKSEEPADGEARPKTLQLKPKESADGDGGAPKSLQLKPKESSASGDEKPALQLKPKASAGAGGDGPPALQLKPKMGGSEAPQLRPKVEAADEAPAEKAAPAMQVRKKEALPDPAAIEQPSVTPVGDGGKRRLSLASKGAGEPTPPPPPPGLEAALGLDVPSSPPASDGETPAGAGESNGEEEAGLQSLDPRKTRARLQAERRHKLVKYGSISAGVFFVVVITVFFWSLFRGPQQQDVGEASPLARPKEQHTETGAGQTAVDPAVPVATVDPIATTPPEGTQEPAVIELPAAVIAMVENKLGANARDELQAEWAGKSRDERIAYLVYLGLWQGAVPDGAKALLPAAPAPVVKPPAPVGTPAGGDGGPQKVDAAQREAQYRKAMAASDLRTLAALVATAPKLINIAGPDGQTALHLAARFGDADRVADFIKAGADLKARDQDGNSPLHAACMVPTGDRAAAELLLKAGASVTAGDNFKATPLHAAAAYGQFAITRLLLQNKADAQIEDLQGLTPLHVAENAQVAELLLAAGASRDARDAAGNAPIHRAAAAGRTDVVAKLTEKGTDVNLLDRTLATPLYLAVTNNRPDTVKELLRLGGSPMLKNEAGETALALALRIKATPVITQALQRSLQGEKPEPEAAVSPTRQMLATGSADLGDRKVSLNSAVCLLFPARQQLTLIALPIQLSPEDESRILAGKMTEAAQILYGKPVPEGWDEIPHVEVDIQLPSGLTSFAATDCTINRVRYYGFSGVDSVVDLGDRVSSFSKLQSLSAGSLSAGGAIELTLQSRSNTHRHQLALRIKGLVVVSKP